MIGVRLPRWHCTGRPQVWVWTLSPLLMMATSPHQPVYIYIQGLNVYEIYM